MIAEQGQRPFVVPPLQPELAAAPPLVISDGDFQRIQRMFHEMAGIELAASKKPLVVSRLAKRLRLHGISRYGDYLALLDRPERAEERQSLVDLLTTHETYFFREPQHFELLRERVLKGWPPREKLRIWSAACSTGEEPYTLAMVAEEMLGGRGQARQAQRIGGDPWELLATDISLASLESAAAGHYAIAGCERIPPRYLNQFCLKGVGPQSGTFLVAKRLRKRVKFTQLNLTESLPEVGRFHVIFLRNVLIYFTPEKKREVVRRVARRLHRGGWLFVGHAESIHGSVPELVVERPSVYRRM